MRPEAVTWTIAAPSSRRSDRRVREGKISSITSGSQYPVNPNGGSPPSNSAGAGSDPARNRRPPKATLREGPSRRFRVAGSGRGT